MQSSLGKLASKTDFLKTVKPARILEPKPMSSKPTSPRVSQRVQEPRSSSRRKQEIDDIVDQQTQLILTTCALFFQGLMKPRQQMNFININCKSIDSGLIKSPYLTQKLAVYVLRNVLPYSTFTLDTNLLSQTEQAYVNTEANQRAIMDRFTAMCKDIKTALSQCKVTHPLSHITSMHDIEDKQLQDFHLMDKSAAKEILTVIALLKSKLELVPASIFVDAKTGKDRTTKEIDYDMALEMQRILKYYPMNVCLHQSNELQDRLMAGLLWFISAFTDWCNYDIISESDVMAAIRMLLPNEADYVAIMNILFVRVQVNSKFREKIYDQCVDHNLYPSDASLDMIISFLSFLFNEDSVAIGIRTRALQMIDNFLQPTNQSI